MKQIIDFFTSIPIDSWRDVVLSSFLIPTVFYLFTKMRRWLVSIRPINLVLAGYRNSKKVILIFLSQLSRENNLNNHLHSTQNQLYISRFPKPLPLNQNNLGIRTYQNIDPVWSQSDGQCAAEVFNLLGQINKHNGFRIADTLKDWNTHFSPIFSIGFNPKTLDLMDYCSPINFKLEANDSKLSIPEHNLALEAEYPSDAGILQKTFTTNSNTPVFILAGLGTTGTEAAGKVLNENCIALGKLYGSGSFCVLFKTDITRGSEYYEIKGIFPKPNHYRALLYPLTFIKWNFKNMYSTNQKTSATA